ncbi:hypothetical protein [Actinomycetospora aeridis]|uniref:Uncharacterized protein n=1 Tax=Actinomycetospora aeridis TaxID=3129231 RepID=A0ABU8N2E6_9PSEU
MAATLTLDVRIATRSIARHAEEPHARQRSPPSSARDEDRGDVGDHGRVVHLGGRSGVHHALLISRVGRPHASPEITRRKATSNMPVRVPFRLLITSYDA